MTFHRTENKSFVSIQSDNEFFSLLAVAEKTSLERITKPTHVVHILYFAYATYTLYIEIEWAKILVMCLLLCKALTHRRNIEKIDENTSWSG